MSSVVPSGPVFAKNVGGLKKHVSEHIRPLKPWLLIAVGHTYPMSSSDWRDVNSAI